MRVDDAFPGNYLKCSDLKGKECSLHIGGVTMEKMGEDTKPVLSFINSDKKMAVNKTNFNSIVAVTGEDDSDNWAGKKITLKPSKTEFQGKIVDCIRVKLEDTPAVPAVEPGGNSDDSPF